MLKARCEAAAESPGMWSLEFTSPRNDSSPCAKCSFCFSFVGYNIFVSIVFLFAICDVFFFAFHRHSECWKLTVWRRSHFFTLTRSIFGCVSSFVLLSVCCFSSATVCAFIQWNIVSFSGKKKIMCNKTCWSEWQQVFLWACLDMCFMFFCLLSCCDSNAFYAISSFRLAQLCCSFVLLLLNNVWLRAEGTFFPLPLFSFCAITFFRCSF